MSELTGRLSTALADRYRIERHLGAGGMATVYLAQDVKHDRKVAVKVLKPELAAVLGAERFVVEIKTTASLSHPHILPLFDSGTADGFLFYVMPFIEGETLRDKLNRETQLGVDEAVRIASDVADALDYAHRHGVIHRDIKPENILLHDGRPMVADFGIALAVSAAAGGRMTETGLSLGTPHYMSPEQATAEKDITARSDVYSLASVLYEMLAGQPPHLGGSAQQIIMRIITDAARPVTELRRAVPAHVAAAVAKALEKLPADRFETAKAFHDALHNPAFSTSAVGAIGTGVGGAAAARGTTETRFRVAATTAVLALGAAAWGWLRPSPPVEVTRIAVAASSAQGLVFNAGSTRLALSPDGREIVYTGPGEAIGTSRLWRRRLDQLTAEPIAGTEGAMNPSFSPDGRRIAFVSSSPRTLRTIALAGGPAITLTDSLVDNGGVAWGSDGYIYFDAHLEGDGLARIREAGGSSPEIATQPAADESWHSIPSALPDGRGVLFSVSRERGASFDIAALDSRTGEHRVLVTGATGANYLDGHLLYVTLDGALMAAPFDLGRLTLRGDAFAVGDRLGIGALARVDLAVTARGHLAYTTGARNDVPRELVWMTRSGERVAVDTLFRRNLAGRAVLSPDGRSAATVALSNTNLPQLWVKRLDRGPVSRLAEFGYSANWTPDGKEIVFADDSGVSRVPADGSRVPSRLRRMPARVGTVELSPEGRWLIFSLGGDLFATRVTGDTTTVLLAGGRSVQVRGTVSPDGRYFAYQSDETGRMEVYVRPFPDAESAKWTVSIEGGSWPRWSRSGRELFYRDEDGGMIAVPVTLAPTFSAGLSRRLFTVGRERMAGTGASFDISPDGSRFLMTWQLEGDQVSELVLVQNFTQELRAGAKR